MCRWIEERRSRRKIVENTDNYVKDENIVNSMFFAQQVLDPFSIWMQLYTFQDY